MVSPYFIFSWKCEGNEVHHLNLGDLGFLLPIPDCQHVIVAVVNDTQVLTGVLKKGWEERQNRGIVCV